MNDPKYNCIRPECHHDVKSFDYYRGSINPEQFFVEKEVVYDYYEDYKDGWKHVEDIPFDPLSYGCGGGVPCVTDLTKKFNGYGFGYSNHIGVGNALNNWYSHTNLKLEKMIQIRDEIRGPIIEKVKEAKKAEDKYKQWAVYNKLIEMGVEGAVMPGGTGEDGTEEVTCSHVAELINSIPLECELIKEVLDEEWAGCDLNNYWWYGWLPTGWLEKDYGTNNDRVPYGGVTGDVPTPYIQHSAVTPPYQSVIGAYQCPDVEIDEETGQVVFESNKGPWYDSFGGATADPCGCIGNIESKIKKPDYIEKCNFPHYGERYPEYLEYVRSIDAQYWDTNLKSPLLRNAQLELLKSQTIEIQVPANSKIRIGDIVECNFAATTATNVQELNEHPLSGRWLVTGLTHTFDKQIKGSLFLTLRRDSQYIER